MSIGGATHVLDYAFAATPACAQTGPGRNSNRSSMTDTLAGTPSTTAYCYDNRRPSGLQHRHLGRHPGL